MAAKEESHLKDLLNKKQKKVPVGSDVDEKVFNFPYLIDQDTVSFVREHGRIMFIIRGPNSTCKSALSEMIMHRYTSAELCCADHYFSKTFASPVRTKESLKASHNYCEKKVERACMRNRSPIIVQNTHIRKFELQKYIDLAAVYNYTVIMGVTLYKFDVTPEALGRINTDGLSTKYFQIRLRQWEDILPLFIGWFLSPDAVNFVLKSLQTTLSALLSDGKFCRIFNCYDDESIWNYFSGRRNLYIIAGYSSDTHAMKTYYLSDLVQECYGKSYCITIHGYLITESGVVGIVQIDEEMACLLFNNTDSELGICEKFSSIALCDNINEYKATVPVCHDDVISKNILLEDWKDDDINLKNCELIHIALRKSEPFDIRIINDVFFNTLNSVTDEVQFTELEDINICRLCDEKWLVKLPKKIKVKTVFTGLYV